MRIDRAKFAATLARKDLTVKRLAELSGLSRGTITGVKTGKSCNKSTADKLVAILGPSIIEQRKEA